MGQSVLFIVYIANSNKTEEENQQRVSGNPINVDAKFQNDAKQITCRMIQVFGPERWIKNKDNYTELRIM